MDTPEEHQEIETLKTLRLQLEITQEELSRRLDLSFRTVGDWETGKKLPRFDNAAALSRELGVSLKSLAQAFRVDVAGVPPDYNLTELKAVAADLGIERVEDLPADFETMKRMRDRQN
ncbi:helix-turn-helix transcriptional regulator [Microcoleus sp. AT9b-C5]|uniref:helix-turn-helix transcriptional regulator n=1 Tax=unclassified Microcoleus TaxID=2642155 RepID=UPI002FD77D8B